MKQATLEMSWFPLRYLHLLPPKVTLILRHTWKTIFRGKLSLMKNANRAFALLAQINIGKWGRPLTGAVYPA
ncbi:MAG: hypothetical protein Q7S46_08995 [Gallionella sp.]|nr:hypothetical protein [Gallionella sp.]